MKKFTAIVLSSLTIGICGCTPEKAEQLRAAALNFRNAAHTAIAAVEELQQAEIAAPPRTSAEKDQEFVKNMMTLSTSTVLDQNKFQTVLDPDSIQLSADEKSESAAMAQGLRDDYSEFAEMFEPLPMGSFLAQKSIPRTKKLAQKLVAQLVNIAKRISQNPPRLQQQRTRLLGDVRRLLKARQTMAEDEFRTQALAIKERAQVLNAQEAELQRVTVERCLTAALIGKELIPLIDSYNQLNPQDLGNIIQRAFSVQESITGKSFADLRGRLDLLTGSMNADPEIKALLTVEPTTKMEGK